MTLKEQADFQRSQAKQFLLNMFGIGQGASNGAVERIVDSIIAAALLELTSIQQEITRSKVK